MSAADHYWKQFLDTMPSEIVRPPGCYEAFRFGTTSKDATEIAALALAGVKTSTGSLQWTYDAEGRPPPAPGQFSIVLNGDDRPVGVIETVEVRMLRLDEVDASFAFDGGEGDR